MASISRRICSTRALIASAVPAAADDRRVVLVEDDALGPAQLLERHVLQLDAEILRNHLRAGEYRNVLQHGLASVAEAGGLDRAALQPAAHMVDDEGRQRFALDVLGDHEQRRAGLRDLSSRLIISLSDVILRSTISTSAFSSTASIFSISVMK